ncbi:uncharacterized protein EI90DRAFT_2939226 [Cantharellus anzutake]|uniref:uncharacterized protein n=1 Tax=Cantharellus anzutake TaxID=1750568 RepID=UPI00190471A2|nr:uncharacterized protein EI90DRAFT_2939226 [Cantharellus anzutake]KAF8320527.1 hypothetical protein EI90DRAFT_2939226 [Cantharellus anzutake]
MDSKDGIDSQARIFNEHFKDPHDDVVLRSKENIHFRVHSIILRNTSSFFRTMFSLPQTGSSSSEAEHCLHLDEEDWVIEAALRMCCGMPIQIEHLRSFDTIEPLLHFCDKYGMNGPISIMQAAISSPELISDPIRLYKLACQFSWEAEMQLSARLALRFDFTHPDIISQLSGIDFADFARLLGLVRRRKDIFESRLNNPDDFNGSNPHYACRICGTIVNDPTWRILRMVLIRELEKCPLGDTIRGEEFLLWPETVACMSATHCSRALYHSESTRKHILELLDALPTELE